MEAEIGAEPGCLSGSPGTREAHLGVIGGPPEHLEEWEKDLWAKATAILERNRVDYD